MPDILSGKHAEILPSVTSDIKYERHWSEGRMFC